MPRTLLHLIALDGWPPSFPIAPGPEGFIHLCTPAQAEAVLGRFFAGGPAWALVVDAAVEPDVRDEDSYGHGAYPHLYAPLWEEQVLARLQISASRPVAEAVAEALASPAAER